MSAIFISHSSRDDAIAAEVRQRLTEHGHRSVFLDFDPSLGIPPGRDWEQELYHQLRTCRAVLVLCSEHSMSSKWCFAEITHAKALGKHVFPIKVAPCTINPVLAARQVLDLTTDKEEAYRRLGHGLRTAGLDPADAFDWDGSRSPYPGLLAFQEADAAVFFGRDTQVQQGLEFLNRLRQFGGSRVLVVLGASGSGKSSLVRAGIIPRLRRDRTQWLIVAPFRPLDDPLRELAIVFSEVFADHNVKRDWQLIATELERATGDGGDALNDLAGDLRLTTGQREATVVLIIDQAEELLGHGNGDSANLLLPMLRSALEARNSPLMVIATLRSDFLGDFQQHPVVRELRFEDLGLGPLSNDDLIRVIEGPARLAAVELEPGLSEVMVGDTKTDDALPLLAFTLRELYERCGGDNLLEIAEYRDQLGGLEGSVARAAEGVFVAEPLSVDRKTELQAAFLAMVRINEEGQYSRQMVHWADLPAGVHDTLERFVQARLLASRGEGGERILEVAHEALFRSWRRLRSWLDRDREFLMWRKRLGQAYQEWHHTGRDPGALLDGSALEEGRMWLARRSRQLRGKEADLIRESIRVAAGRQRRRLFLLGGAVALLIGIAVAGIVLWQSAETEREKAETATSEALDLARVAVATEWLPRDPTRAALVLLEVENPSTTSLANLKMREALRTGLSFFELEEQRGVKFSPSGSHLLTLAALDTARVWPLDSSGESVVLEGGVAAAFSPDGDRVLTLSSDGKVRISGLDGLLESSLQLKTGKVNFGWFSPRGDWLLIAPEGDRHRLWRLDRSEERLDLGGHAGGMAAHAFSPLGDRLLTVSYSGLVRVWRLEGPQEPVRLAEGLEEVMDGVFSPNGDWVVIGHGARITLLQADGLGEPIELVVPPFDPTPYNPDHVSSVAFHPNGDCVATGWTSGNVRVYAANGSGALEAQLKGHYQAVQRIEFSPRGERMLTMSEGDHAGREAGARFLLVEDEARKQAGGWLLNLFQHARLGPSWLVDLRLARELRGHIQSWNYAAAFSPDAELVATSAGGAVRLWKVDQPGDYVEFESYRTGALHPDGNRVLVGSSGVARIWNIDGTGDPVELVGAPAGYAVDAWFSPAGDRVLTSGGNGELRLWSTDGSGEPVELGEAPYSISSASFSPGGNRIATPWGRSRARIWKTDGSGDFLELEHNENIKSVTFSPTGDQLLTTSADSTVRVWQADGSGAFELDGDAQFASSPSFSPSGDRIVIGYADGSARVWSVRGSGVYSTLLEGHTDQVLCAAFGPGGHRVVTGSADGTARVWQADGLGEVVELKGHTGHVLSAAFSPDGDQVVTASADSTARIWNADGSGEADELRGHEKKVVSAAFNSTGDRVVTVSDSVRVWIASSAGLKQAIKAAVISCLEPEFREKNLGEAPEVALKRYQDCERAHGRVP